MTSRLLLPIPLSRHIRSRESWFGSPKGVHIDSWMAVDGIEGWRVEMSPLAPLPDSPRLYFINLGGYESQTFGEAHHYVLVVAKDKREAMANPVPLDSSSYRRCFGRR